MRGILVVLCLLPAVYCSCPAGFELVRDGECRGKYKTVNTNWYDATHAAIKKCKEIQGQPVIIHNDEHQSYWRARVPSNMYLFTGIVCNTTSKRWQWADGSAVDYKPSDGYSSDLDEECVTGYSWDLHEDGYWNSVNAKTVDDIPIFCTTQLQQPTGDGCDSFNDDADDGICYLVRPSALNWGDAQATCSSLGATVASIHNLQENQFVRRAAVSQGAVNGVYLGATSPGNNSFGWIDGSAWDYKNFYPGFPIAGHGNCLAMDTLSNSGEWMNMDCGSKLGVACAKTAEPRHACTAGPWLEGQTIYTPGYPYDASEPCDYFLTVAPGKRVQVLLLEANTCCDHLILVDDVLGGNLVANLTGEISNTFYTTKSSNFMRVSWVPNGGVNVRGAMFTFTAV